MTDIPLPAIITEYPTKEYVASIPGIRMLDIALKIARNIHMRCRLAEAQNWKCCWCGVECRPEPDHKDSATIEHVQPRSLGGANSWENYAMACAHCNHRRGVTSIEDFMAGKVACPGGPKDKKDKHERMVAKRMRKYRKQIIRFNLQDWTRDGRDLCSTEWLGSLNLPEHLVSELEEMIE